MKEQLGGAIPLQETLEKQLKTKSTIKIGGAEARLAKKKSEYPNYIRVEMISPSYTEPVGIWEIN